MDHQILKSAREVVSRYLGQNAEDDDMPWMEHLKKTQEPLPGLSHLIDAIAPAVKSAPSTNDGKNLDNSGMSLQEGIIDPKSMAREQGSPAIRSDVEDLESGSVPITNFNNPNMYNQGSPLGLWWDSREREDLATGTPFGQQTSGLPVEASTAVPMLIVSAGTLSEEMGDMGVRKDAKTLQQIMDSNTHSKRVITEQRGHGIRPVLASTKDEMRRGLLHFKMRSRGSEHERHVVFQFLKRPDGRPTQDPIRENDCLIGCTCPAFLFWGPQYYAVEGQYMFKDMQRETIVAPDGEAKGAIVAPGVYAPSKGKDSGVKTVHRGVGGTFCKHIYAAYLAAKGLMHEVESDALMGSGESLLDKDEASLQPEHLMEELPGMSTFEQFRQYLITGGIPDDLKDFVSDLMAKHGSSLGSLDKYIASPWNAWMGSQSGSEVASMLKAMDQWKTAPSVMVYVLKSSVPVLRKNGKAFPPAIVRKAYRILKNWG